MSTQTRILQLVEFLLGKDYYTLPITNVQEIIKIVEIVHIPESPDFVEGVINLRGKIVPVVDLKKKFALPTMQCTSKSRIIIAEMSSQIVGLIVDDVYQVINIEESYLEARPAITVTVNRDFIQGVIKYENKMLIALDANKILTPLESEKLKDVK